MTNSSVGTLMYLGVRHFGWIFWLWHKIKQKIGRGQKMSGFDRLVQRVVINTWKKMDWYKDEMERSFQGYRG